MLAGFATPVLNIWVKSSPERVDAGSSGLRKKDTCRAEGRGATLKPEGRRPPIGPGYARGPGFDLYRFAIASALI
jgi:hypothetical protein